MGCLTVIEPNLRLQKHLEGYVEFWARSSRRSLGLLSDHVAPNFVFSDPYHRVGGGDVERLLAHRFAVFEGGRYEISDFMWGRRDSTAYICWSFRYFFYVGAFIKRRCDEEFFGVSQVSFLPEGEILSQNDVFGISNAALLKCYQGFDLTKDKRKKSLD